jgi:hypothetical protein
MRKTFTSRTARLSAVVTGRARERGIGPEEAHVRNVVAITRRIHRATDRVRVLKAELRSLQGELRFARRELRVALQRDATITAVDLRLEAAGCADAIDATAHRSERGDA